MRLSRLAMNTLAAFMVLLGAIWIFQGMGLLGGSFMKGESMWSGIGAVVAVGGLALGFVANGRSIR